MSNKHCIFQKSPWCSLCTPPCCPLHPRNPPPLAPSSCALFHFQDELLQETLIYHKSAGAQAGLQKPVSLIRGIARRHQTSVSSCLQPSGCPPANRLKHPIYYVGLERQGLFITPQGRVWYTGWDWAAVRIRSSLCCAVLPSLILLPRDKEPLLWGNLCPVLGAASCCPVLLFLCDPNAVL